MLDRVLVATAACALAVTALLTAPTETAGARTTVVARSTAAPDCGRTVRRADGSVWRCSFVDDFDGTALDTGRWRVGQTARTGFNVGHTCFEPGNVTVRNGHLRLTAKQTHTIWCRSFLTRYTGGLVETAGSFAQTYGRFEVRARYPRTGAGLRAGFWMYPERMIYGRWPASGEIDVAEWWSNARRTVLPTLHYTGSTTADSGWRCKVADPTAWHTYRTVWTSRVITFSIDGKRCFGRQWRPSLPLAAPQPFDHPFHLTLNMAVDANSRNNRPDATTVLPATYLVDYVKAWR
jgi:beta-glucanase (GH16 family)